MKMFILKIHTEYGYKGTSDYNLAVSSSKERLEELTKDFLEKLSKIRKKIALDFNEWSYENTNVNGISRLKASEKIEEDAWLSFQGESALDFLEIKGDWSMYLSEFDIEEVEVV